MKYVTLAKQGVYDAFVPYKAWLYHHFLLSIAKFRFRFVFDATSLFMISNLLRTLPSFHHLFCTDLIQSHPE